MSDLREVLNSASNAAKVHYNHVRDEHGRVREAFSSFELSMDRMERQLATLGQRHEALAAALRDILVTRRRGVRTCWDEWSNLLEQRQSDLEYFTVMLFGRTGAGKSTTLEALAGGDGSRISPGLPDFTRSVEAVEWAGLRVVDTPGIEGFSPDTIGVAEAFIDRADIVVFVICDTHIEPDQLDRLAVTMNRRKPLLILLNVKCHLDRLLRNPLRVFRQDAIDGHIRRIRGYLQQALSKGTVFFDSESVPIIPCCVEAANAARNFVDFDFDTREKLFQLSRFSEAVEHVLQTISERGVGIRTVAAYESFMGNLEGIEDGLRVELARVLAQAKAIRASTAASDRLFEDLENEGRQEFLTLREHFYSVDAKIDAFVDRVIDGHITDPKSEFDRLVDMPGVQKRVQYIGARCMEAMEERIREFQRQSSLDFNLAADLALGAFFSDVSVDVDSLNWAEVKKWTGKWGKIVGAPAAGFLASVAVFAGPPGWITAGLALLAGAIASAGIAAISKAVQGSGKKDIVKARADLRRKLRKQCTDICERKVIRPSVNWLLRESGRAKRSVREGLAALEKELDHFIEVAGEFVSSLEEARNHAALCCIKAVLPLVMSNRAVSECEIVSAARRISYRAKVAVKGRNGQSAAGLFIGRGGENIRRLSSHFSGQSIDVVDVSASTLNSDMVRAALFPARLKDAEVEIFTGEEGYLPLVKVYARSIEDVKYAVGKHKWNLRLAEAILNCSIQVTLKGGITDEGRE